MYLKILPFHYFYDSAAYKYKQKVGVKTNLTSNKNIQFFNSSYFDFAHLVGAAYCDIFTCDKIVSDFIEDKREKLGKLKQISGNKEKVYEQIRKQFQFLLNN